MGLVEVNLTSSQMKGSEREPCLTLFPPVHFPIPCVIHPLTASPLPPNPSLPLRPGPLRPRVPVHARARHSSFSPCACRGADPQPLLADGQGALVQKLSLLILALIVIECRQVVQAGSRRGVSGSQLLFTDD
jgi:hypothetical protein